MKAVLILVVLICAFLLWRAARRRSRAQRPPAAAPERPQAPPPVSRPVPAHEVRPTAPTLILPRSPVNPRADAPPSRSEAAAPVVAAPVVVAPAVAAPLLTTTPPGTAALDEPDAQRPEISADVVATARAAVQGSVPDDILSDALLDVTPEQLSRLMAAVPQDVMARAIGQIDDVSSQKVTEEDRQKLEGLGSALDDLDFWSLGDTTEPGTDQGGPHRA